MDPQRGKDQILIFIPPRMKGKEYLVCVWLQIKKPVYFTIQFIFSIIHEPHYIFFDTIHVSYCIILVNFYFYLQYFQQKVFNFRKISEFQIEP